MTLFEAPRETGNNCLIKLTGKSAKLKCSEFSTWGNRKKIRCGEKIVFYSKQVYRWKYITQHHWWLAFVEELSLSSCMHRKHTILAMIYYSGSEIYNCTDRHTGEVTKVTVFHLIFIQQLHTMTALSWTTSCVGELTIAALRCPRCASSESWLLKPVAGWCKSRRDSGRHSGMMTRRVLGWRRWWRPSVIATSTVQRTGRVLRWDLHRARLLICTHDRRWCTTWVTCQSIMQQTTSQYDRHGLSTRELQIIYSCRWQKFLKYKVWFMAVIPALALC